MCRDGHPELNGLPPEQVVLGCRRTRPVRERTEADAAETDPPGPLQLRDGVLDARCRDDRVADEPVRGDGAVVLGQEIVEGPHHGHIRLAVLDVLDEAGDEHRRVEHLGIDAVPVLLAETLACVAGARDRRRPVGLPVRAALDLERSAGGNILAVVNERAPLDDPPLTSGAQLDQPRRPVHVLVRHVPDPGVRRDLQMPVA